MRQSTRCDLTRSGVQRGDTKADKSFYTSGEFSNKVIMLIQRALFSLKSLLVVDEVDDRVMVCTEVRVEGV